MMAKRPLRLRTVCSLLVLGFSSLPAFSADPPAAGPTPYPDPKDESAWPGKGPIRLFGWMVDNRKFFWTAREKDQGKIVLVGDSLMGGWKADLLAGQFPDRKIANRGIGGDVSRGVLFRFKEDVLDLNPAAVVICCGTNDLSAHANPAAVEGNLKLIIAQAREHNPALPIILFKVPPRDSKEAPTKPGAHEDLNARIAKFGEGDDHLLVLDTFTLLADENGKPNPEYFAKDKLHFAKPGYDKLAELLKPAFDKLGVK